MEKLLNTICSQQFSRDELKRSSKESSQPPFIVFLPRKAFGSQNLSWNGDVIRIRASEIVQLALNSTELTSLHLVVARSDQWKKAVEIFQEDVGSTINNQLITRLARDEDLRLTFDQLSVRLPILLLLYPTIHSGVNHHSVSEIDSSRSNSQCDLGPRIDQNFSHGNRQVRRTATAND